MPGCQVHETIVACHEYCDAIDAEWLRIADWYRPGTTPARGITAADLYASRVAEAIEIRLEDERRTRQERSR